MLLSKTCKRIKMKKIYIVPQTLVVGFGVATEMLAGSNGDSGSGGYYVDKPEEEKSEKGDITTSDGSGLEQCSKGFDAWSSWDD